MLRPVVVPLVFLWVLVARVPGESHETHFTISGVTIDAVTGQPVTRTEVSIGKVEDFETPLQKELTETDGRFAFTGLQHGKYWLAARRNGFRRQGYDQHGGYASAVVVGPGLISGNLIFRIHPDASIGGKIIDPENEAVPNAKVLLFKTDLSTGFNQFFYVEQVSSDDRGNYHFGHLESGQYFVVVSAQPWYSSIVPALHQGTGGDPSVRNSALDMVYPTTYYPGVREMSSASPISLHDGESFVADITPVPEPALRLRVNHVNGDAQQQPRSATLKQPVFGAFIDLPSSDENTIDDAVEISGIPAGKYVLDLQSYNRTVDTHCRMVDIRTDTEVDANGTTPLPLIHGIIQMDGAKVRSHFLRLWNPHTQQMLDTQYADNGEFSVNPEFLTSGNYFVLVTNGENSIISSIEGTGAKVIGQSIQLRGSTPVQLSIRLSHSLSAINGTALRDGKPIPGAMIVLVPDSPEFNLPLFRRDQSDSDGTFTLRDVLPGRYKIVGIDDGWDLEWANPALLKTRLAHAIDEVIQPNMTYKIVVNVE
jgi:Carboxypeptidase regulatory-like domain